MTRAWLAALVGFLLVPVVPAVGAADPEIAALYVEAAYDAYREGQNERASRLVDIAREFAGTTDDVLYVAALVAAETRDGVRDAIALLERALEVNAWSRFAPLNGAVFLGHLYNQTGRHDEAVDLLRSFSERPDTPLELLSEYFYELLYALYSQDRLGEMNEMLGSVRDRFPDEARFFWFSLQQEPFPSLEYRREIERLLTVKDAARKNARVGIDDLLFAYGMRVSGERERRWALSRLQDREWADPSIALLEASVESGEPVRAFLDRDGLADYGVYRELLSVVNENDRTRLLDAARTYSGQTLSDPDRDGIWNERLHVDAGRIERWERDADQDGLVELEVLFDRQAPVRTIYRSAQSVLRLDYGQYPFVSEGELEAGGRAERYVVRPRSVRLDLLQPLPASGPLLSSDVALASEIRRVERRELVAAAVQTDLVRPDGTVAERSYYQDGVMRRVQRDGDADGVWDHLLLTDGARATSGLRDLDADGYFEVAEGYVDGRLVALAVDADKDGAPEVFEREDDAVVREWDLNGDGLIDVREFSFWTDAVIREFPFLDRPLGRDDDG